MIEKAIAQGLPALLTADANLSAYTIKLYPHVAPQTASYPFITYASIATVPDVFMNPSAQTDQKFTESNIELTVWAETKQSQDLITHSLRTILHGRTGAFGNLNLSRCLVTDISTFSESDISGSDENIYRASVICNFSYFWEA